MFDNISKYWPLLTVCALAVVSVFNIGYFSVIGLHFIGVMDLSNIVYAVGLVFGLALGPVVMFPHNWIDRLREVAARPDTPRRLHRLMRWFTGVVVVGFTVGLFIHRPYISITGLFALTYLAGFIAFTAYCYVMWKHLGALSLRVGVSWGAFLVWTLFWIGGAVAHHEAFGTSTLYIVTAKSSVLKNVRLVRSSSSGFILAQGQTIIFLPLGELQSIAAVDPAP